MVRKKYVVVGGVACGPKAASRLRRLDPEAQITIVEKGELLSYGGCLLPYYLSGEVKKLSDLWCTPVGVPRDSHFFKAVKNIDVMNRTLAVKINRADKKLETVNLDDGKKSEIEYDELVLATGATPFLPPIKGLESKNVFKLNHPYDAENIKKAVEKGDVKSAVIVGGGLIGLEVTEALVRNGIKVSIVETMDTLLPRMLDRDMALLFQKYLDKKQVGIYTNSCVKEFEADDTGMLRKVITSTGEIEAQLALVSAGVRPNTSLAAEAGLDIQKNGAVRVNEFLQTSDPNIYAGGDCINNWHMIADEEIYMPLGDLANIHGRIIANNIAGTKEEFDGILGTGVCQVFDYNISAVGLTEAAAAEKGYAPVSVIVPDMDRSKFLPGAGLIYIKLVADRNTQEILGAQITGCGDVTKRTDALSVGMSYAMTAEDLSQLDLAYAPPFSPALDCLITAGNVLRNKLNGPAKSINPLEVKEKIDNDEDFIFLDVRSGAEVEKDGFIDVKQWVHIPLGEMRQRYGELPKDKEIITLCKISLRGYEAQRILDEHCYKNVKFMDGGNLAWPFGTDKDK